jgi:hypothetical protein
MALTILEKPRSPNHNSRRNTRVQAIVLHATAGTNSLAHLCNSAPGGKSENAVSAHYLIAQDGTINHLVENSRRAWHAGVSFIPGLAGDVNSLSIGIEIENTNTGIDPYPQPQLDATIELVQQLVLEFGISRQFVVRHADIALPVGRKSDPQAPAFNIESFLDSVYGPGGMAGLLTTDMVAIVDQLNIREGAGTDFAAVAQLNEGDVIQVDKMVVGETINGHRGWAHLADNRGFVTSRFLRIQR